jgi:GntR family transcriptional regulator
MLLNVDHRSGVPIYIQIVEQVRALVQTGELAPGDQLPTVRQLAEELRINFNTVARAYRMLDEAGVISTQQGRGTYILETSPALDSALRQEERRQQAAGRLLDELTRQYVEEATGLGCSIEEIQEAFEGVAREWGEDAQQAAVDE